MQSRNPILDDLAKVASGALSVATGVKDEVEARLRQQFERVIDGMDLVTREELDVVKAMAAEARAENERLAKRLAAVEAALASTKPADKPTAKPAAKHPAKGTAKGAAKGPVKPGGGGTPQG